MFRPFVLLLTILSATAAGAQQVTPPRRDRAALEQRFRERLEQVLKERLALTDAQLSHLIEVNRRLDGQRRALFREEREVRREMRDALKGGDDQASQERVGALMDRALRVQRQRLELVETEQRELATMLTPVQRAKYLGMQEQLRRRAEDMQRRAEGDSAGNELGMPDYPRSGERRPFPRRPQGDARRIP